MYVRFGSRLFQNTRRLFHMTTFGFGLSIFGFYGFVLLMRSYGRDFAVCAVVCSDVPANRRKESALCPHRRDQRSDADDVDDAFEIVGQYV